MFNELVKTIAEIKTENDRNECYWAIDRAFHEEHITFDNYELLLKLTDKIEVEED